MWRSRARSDRDVGVGLAVLPAGATGVVARNAFRVALLGLGVGQSGPAADVDLLHLWINHGRDAKRVGQWLQRLLRADQVRNHQMRGVLLRQWFDELARLSMPLVV